MSVKKTTEVSTSELNDMAETSELMEKTLLDSGELKGVEGGSSEPFFNKAYNALRIEKKRMKADLVKNALVRKMEEAWDDAERRKEEANLELFEMRTNIDTYDINVVLRHQTTIARCVELQGFIEDEHMFMFGTDLRKSR